MSRYQILFPFYRDLNKFNNLNPQKRLGMMMIQNYTKCFQKSIFMNTGLFQMTKKESWDNPINLFLETYNYNVWFGNEESTAIN